MVDRRTGCGSAESGAIREIEVDDRPRSPGLVDEAQRRLDNGTLGLAISRCPERAPHGERSDHGARDRHLTGVVAERSDARHDGCNAPLFEDSGYVSDRHVAHGSDGNQKGGVGPGFEEEIGPCRTRLFDDPALSRGPDEGVGIGDHPAHDAL